MTPSREPQRRDRPATRARRGASGPVDRRCWSWPTAPPSRGRPSAGGTTNAADAPATGEVVFNTTLTGYQEVLTDPSYAGQIVCFTYPNRQLRDHRRRQREPAGLLPGLIVRELPPRPSSWRSQRSPRRHSSDEQRLPGLAGIDTRRLTRHIRDAGAMPGGLRAGASGAPALDEIALSKTAARAAPGTDGVGPGGPGDHRRALHDGDGPLRVVAYDFGIKRTILRHLGRLATVEVVPAPPRRRRCWPPPRRGVPLQRAGRSGRGRLRRRRHRDAARPGARVRDLPGPPAPGRRPRRRRPTNCRSAITAATTRCGGCRPAPSRSPARTTTTRWPTGRVATADVTHVNLNDGVVEGLACRDLPAFSVQYHPEAGPGPHDARYLFDEFGP